MSAVPSTLKPPQADAGADQSRCAGMPIYTKIGPATDMQWLFQGRIPRKQVTLIEGANGAGKSFVALDLAARFTRGLAWPAPWSQSPEANSLDAKSTGAEPAGPIVHTGNVLLVTQQDDSATVDRRLAELGADIDCVCRFETVETGEGEELSRRYGVPISSPRPLEFPRDVEIIREALFDTESIGLVVIDSLSDFCDGPARVAQSLRELSKLAREMDVAIVVTLTANCRFDARGALRVTSKYKTDAARCVWCVVADRDNPGRRLFVARRTNSYVEPPGLAFRLHEGHVIWNDKIPIDPLDPLGQEMAIRECLTSALESGSMPAADVLRLGALAGFAAAQLRVVAKLMGIEFRKMPGFGKEGGFEWVLPGAARECGGEKGESRKDGSAQSQFADEPGEPCGVSPRVSGAVRESADEKVEKSEGRKENSASFPQVSSLMPQTPAEGAVAEPKNSKSMENHGKNRGDPNGTLPHEKGRGTNGEERGVKSEGFPQASGVTPLAVSLTSQAQVECTAPDANNSKSMEKRGENGGDSNGRLPRDKYARAQERKRRKQQRRHERLLAKGKK